MAYTLTQLRAEIYANLGNPSELDPDVDSTKLDQICNEGQRQLALWRDPITGRMSRFRSLMAELYFKPKVITGTVGAGSTTSTVVLDTEVGTQDDRYNGWVVEIGGIIKYITDYTGSTRTATVHALYGTAPAAGVAYKLYKRFWLFIPSTDPWASSPSGEHIVLPTTSTIYRAEGNFVEILRMQDLTQHRYIEQAMRSDDFMEFIDSSGDAQEWYRFGNKLYVDTNIDEADRSYRLEYYRLPTDMSADSDTPEIPEMFHYGIILWATAWGYRRAQESSDLYSTNRELVDFMRSTLSQYHIGSERGSYWSRLRNDRMGR